MSGEEAQTLLPGAIYVCVRCGTNVGQSELQSLPAPRCGNCGFNAFAKTRSQLVKQVKAV